MSIFEVNETTTLYDVLQSLNKDYYAIVNENMDNMGIYAVLDISNEFCFRLIKKMIMTPYMIIPLKDVSKNRICKSSMIIQKKIKKLIEKEINKELENAYR